MAYDPKEDGLRAEIERLRREGDQQRAENVRLRSYNEGLSTIQRQMEAKIERLRAALKPFAAIPLWRDSYPDAKTDQLAAQQMRGYIKVADVRAARAALDHEHEVHDHCPVCGGRHNIGNPCPGPQEGQPK